MGPYASGGSRWGAAPPGPGPRCDGLGGTGRGPRGRCRRARGGLPGAWTLRPATQPGAGRRAWCRGWRRWRPALPPDGTGRVWTARGRSARGLGRRLVRWGWPPCRRRTQGAPSRPAGPARGAWRRAWVGQGGQGWRGDGTAGRAGLPPRGPAGGVGGRGAGRTLGPSAGDGPRRVCGAVLGTAHVGRTAPHMHQTGGRAGAVDAADGPGPGGPALAGPGGGHTVEGRRGPRPGSRPALRGRRPPRPAAAAGPASAGEAPAPTPRAAGLALGPWVSEHRPALPSAWATGTGALARHPRLRGAAASVVASREARLWIKAYPQKPTPGG